MSDSAPATFRFETDRLLSPISANEPTGVSLRYEGTYDQIAALRREDDRDLAQGVWKADLKRADWPKVAQTCLLAIETQSKDLQIAGWLLEAWTHLHGFAGLREGLHLVAELCDVYWDGLHPDIRDGDLEFRIAPILWIDEKLSIQVKLLPVTAPQSGDTPRYSLADWELACRLQGQSHGAGSREEITPARFQQSAALTSTTWLVALTKEAESALAATQELVKVLDQHLGRQAPGLPRMRETLETILALCSAALLGREDAPRRQAETEERHQEAHDAMENGNGGFANGNGDSRPIRTRGEAYARLVEAADFLARTEPHSPVPHLVRRAVSWGNLSLEDLLPELVRDNGQLAELYRLLQMGGHQDPK
jgi:type VI secretion system protein ImpA